jgi:glycosyltransferase involved in cell wall biosynthesis
VFGAQTGAAVHAVEISRRITPLADLRSLWRLFRLLRRIRPDVVHGHTPKGGLLAMIAAWLCGVPVRVYHMFGLPMVTATGNKRRLLRWSERLSCRLAHQVFCVSPSLRAVALEERLGRPEKLAVLLNGTVNGVDAEGAFNPALLPSGTREAVRAEYGIPCSAPVVGFVGRLARDKGMVELAEAWKTLRAAYPDLHLLVVGPPEPHDPPPEAVEQLLRSDSRVHQTGEVEIANMPRFYRAMDVLVLPTYREGYGMVLLEAAALELPVIASRIPGCVDVVRDGETGTLVPARDARAVAEAIRRYLNDGGLRRRHGEAGRTWMLRDFRPQDMSEAIRREYFRLLRERGIRAPEMSAPPTEYAGDEGRSGPGRLPV